MSGNALVFQGFEEEKRREKSADHKKKSAAKPGMNADDPVPTQKFRAGTGRTVGEYVLDHDRMGLNEPVAAANGCQPLTI
jgi:hypothetical protein